MCNQRLGNVCMDQVHYKPVKKKPHIRGHLGQLHRKKNAINEKSYNLNFNLYLFPKF